MMSRKKFTLLVFVLGVVSTLVFIFYAKIANAAVANPRFLNKVYIKWNGDDYVDVNPYDSWNSYEKGSTDCRDTIYIDKFDSKTPKAIISIQTYTTQQDGKKTCKLDNGYPKTISMDGVAEKNIQGYKTKSDTIVLIAGARKRTDKNWNGGLDRENFAYLGIDIKNGKPVMHTYINPPKNEWNSPADKNRYKQLKDGATVDAPDSLEKWIYVDLDDKDPSKGVLNTYIEEPIFWGHANHYDIKVGDVVLANNGKITPLPDEIASVAQTNGTGSTGDPGDQFKCEIRLTNPLTWFVCPMIDTARELVNSLNDAINDMLTLPTDKLFVTTNDVANQFYASWSGFRYIAMGLLVIIALIMVLSQAIGVGPFDAYTIRKVLPRLLAAVVLVSLSWPLMKLAVDITNGVGHSVSGLIYKPFGDQLHPGNPSNGFMGAVFTGVIASGFVFGLVGLLAFVATAALSLLSGMATLIFREMLIMFLVVVAPVAIICSILPNTQIVWKKWSDYFLRALIVFPIFSGVIAIGQVFAVIGPELHTGPVGDLIQFIGYFGPYFMLPKIFAMSGGAVAAVGSVAQKATAGMRGGLSNYRNKKAGKRVTNAGVRSKDGKFLPGRCDRFGGNAINRRVSGVAGGAKAGFGFGDRGRAYETGSSNRVAAEAKKAPGFEHNKYEAGALKALTDHSNEHEARAAGVSDANIQIAKTMGGWSVGTRQAALEQRFANKDGFDNAREAMATINTMSGGNARRRTGLMATGKYISKQVGRDDMGALSLRATNASGAYTESEAQWNNRMTDDGFENITTYALGSEHAISYNNMAVAHAVRYDEAVQAYAAAPNDINAKNRVIETRTKLEETMKNAGSATGANARAAARLTALISGPDAQLRTISRDSAGNLDGGVSILGPGTAPDPNHGDAEGAVGTNGLARAPDEEYRKRMAREGNSGPPEVT